MDVIKFYYGREFMVDEQFDLNQLRRLNKVKKVGSTYILDPDNTEKIEVIIEANFVLGESQTEKVIVEELTKDKDQYSKLWTEERERTNKLSNELNCAKLEIDALKKG
jgi:hypothetical protein